MNFQVIYSPSEVTYFSLTIVCVKYNAQLVCFFVAENFIEVTTLKMPCTVLLPSVGTLRHCQIFDTSIAQT